MDAWNAFKWVWAAVIFAYLIVQGIAVWRLDDDGKKTAQKVLIGFLVVETASNFVRDVFEVRAASRAGAVAVALAAAIAIVILTRMLARNKGRRELVES
jgi:tryptophan-rich sensory protein